MSRALAKSVKVCMKNIKSECVNACVESIGNECECICRESIERVRECVCRECMNSCVPRTLRLTRESWVVVIIIEEDSCMN